MGSRTGLIRLLRVRVRKMTYQAAALSSRDSSEAWKQPLRNYPDANVDATQQNMLGDEHAVLVDVLREFLATNNRGWRSIDDIVADMPRWHRSAVHQLAVYQHFGMPYLATISVHQEADVWPNINLNTHKHILSLACHTNMCGIPRHDHSHWMRMPKHKLGVFDSLRTTFREQYSGVKVLTHEFMQKVEMKFFAKDPAKTPHMLIGFESSDPYCEEGPEDADAC